MKEYKQVSVDRKWEVLVDGYEYTRGGVSDTFFLCKYPPIHVLEVRKGINLDFYLYVWE